MARKSPAKLTPKKERIRVEYVAPADLNPASYNPRQISDAEMAKLERSLSEFGVVDPIIARREDGEVIGGHQRLEAAKRKGIAEVPVVYLDNLTDGQAKLLNLALNRISGEWDMPRLGELLADLGELPDIDLSMSGFDVPEMNKAITEYRRISGGLTDDDAVPDVPEEPVTKLGDLYVLGDHRLLCGDATKAGDVEQLMGGARMQAVVTDPPYGIEREGITNDDPAGLSELYDAALSVLPCDDATVIAFQSPRLFPAWLDAVRAAGHKFERMLWLYKQNDCTFPWRGWILKSESILVSSVGAGAWPGQSGKHSHDCYLIQWDSENKVDVPGWHASIKPFTVVSDLVERTTGEVYDPFLGSGTTMIACEKLGRHCYGMEIEPRYVDVAVRRWEEYTGGKATKT